MKNKTVRYALYFGIGVMLYYTMKGDKEGSESLNTVHEYAPWIIISIVILSIVLKFVKDRYEKRNEGE